MGRRRARRRGGGGSTGAGDAAGAGADNDDPVTAEEDGAANDGGRQPRRSGVVSLITQVKDEHFFDAKRTIADIRDELAKKGHNLKSSDISGPLLSLTQQNVLKREKDGHLNQWVYFTA
jgi:hypothetical protein